MKKDLLDYFRKSWKPDYSYFKYSGWALLDKIYPDEEVLDIGCGYNLFKPHLGIKLYGIDPANDKADEVVGIMEFNWRKKFSVILNYKKFRQDFIF